MTTTVIKSIGTSGRDYSTLALWAAAIPVNLVTADQVWVGECYNDSEFTAGVTISGLTTDATRYAQLTAASGQSFQDNASVRTNPLVYDQSKGVGIKPTSPNKAIFVNNAANTQITRLQVFRTNAGYDASLVQFASSGGCTIKDCIIGMDGVANSATSYELDLGAGTAINLLVYDKTSSGNSKAVGVSGGFVFYNCTIVNGRGSAQGTGIDLVYGSGGIQSTAVFGWTTAVAGTSVNFGDYNATDAGSFPGGGSHNQVSKTYANQFTSTTGDWSLKSGSDCIAHGNTDATKAPKDITNFTRASGTGGSIGAWEFASAGTLLKANNVVTASISKLDLVSYASVKSANGLTTGN